MSSRFAPPLFRQALLAVAVGCALAACGGGGGDGNNGNGGSAQSQGQSDSAQAQARTGTQSDTGKPTLDELLNTPVWRTSPQRLDEQDDLVLEISAQVREQNAIEADNASAEIPIPYEGAYTTPEGVRMRISEWINYVNRTCPFADRLTSDPASAAPARFQCLAGTYEGMDFVNLAPCRTTLMADGTVVHQNGNATLKPFRILPESFQYNNSTVFGKPLLMASNYAAPWSFGQFVDLLYMDGEIPGSESGATRYEFAKISQENYNPENGPPMDRTCLLKIRQY